MTTSPPPDPFGLTISPVKGPASINSTHTVTVYDQGHTPLTVTMTAREIVRNQQGKCQTAAHDATWATVTPAHFTLKPGTHRVTTLHISSGTAPGEHDLTAWATTPTGTVQHGSVLFHTNAALGSQFLVRVPGTVSSTAPAPCLTIASPPAGTGLPITLIAGLGCLVVFLVIGVLVVRWLRRPARPASAHARRRRTDD